MSFTLNKKGSLKSFGSVNLFNDYKTIAENFCKEYYTLYDDNVEKMQKLYHPEAKFVYFDHEINTYNSWLNALKHNGFYKFSHGDMVVNVVPLNDTNLNILVIGKILINNGWTEHKFCENIMLQKDGDNCFYICTTMFRIVD
jgi:hypothetical protein